MRNSSGVWRKIADGVWSTDVARVVVIDGKMTMKTILNPVMRLENYHNYCVKNGLDPWRSDTGEGPPPANVESYCAHIFPTLSKEI